MDHVLELFYNQCSEWDEEPRRPDAEFEQAKRLKKEYLGLLMDSMTLPQKELMDAYGNANAAMNDRIDFDRFFYAFHLGAQLMAELIQGRADLLGN